LKLACIVEVERHCIEPKESLVFKTDQSFSKQEVKSMKQEARHQKDANPEIVSRPQSKTQKAKSKASTTNVNDDWTLTIP